MSWISSAGRRGVVRRSASSPQSRPAVASPKVARAARVETKKTWRKPKAQTLNERDKHTMKRSKTELKTKPEMKRASKTDLLTQPTNVPKPSASAKTKTKSKMEPTIPMCPQLYQQLGDYVFEGDMSNTITELKSEANLPPPIELDYSIHQTGSSSRLRKYRKMYPSTTYEIPRLDSTLHPNRDGVATTEQVQNTSVCGFGRAGVFWPYSWFDHEKSFNAPVAPATRPDHLKTCQQSNFNRTQIESCMKQMFDDAWSNSSSPPVSWADFEKAIEEVKGGDQSYSFPMDSIESQFKYENRNVQLPCYLSVYICTPRKDLPEIHTPQSDWFNPWALTSATSWTASTMPKMRSDYFYNPAVTAQENTAVTGTDPAAGSLVKFKENVDNILTIATEVVKEATPSGFSAMFNENWKILTVKQVRLLPGQTLILNLKTHLSQPLNLDRFLGNADAVTWPTTYGPTLFRNQSFKGLTLHPMIRFYGDECAGASKGLGKSVTPETGQPLLDIQNRVFQSTAVRSGPTMITGNHTVKARCSVPNAPLAGVAADFVSKIGIESILMNFSTRARNLFKFDAPERGQQCSYWKINDFAEYFAGNNIKRDGTLYTQVIEFNPRLNGGVDHDSNPTWAELTLLNPQVDKNWLEIDVSSERSQKSLKADVGVKA